MEDIEQSNSDVASEVSSEPQEQAVEQTTDSEAQASGSKPNEDNLPFHQHPRWVERENEWKQRFSSQESEHQKAMQRLEAIERSQQTPQAAEDALIARLKGIDPEFGARIEKLQNSLSKLDQMEAYIQQSQAKERTAQAQSALTQLHTEYKVPKDLQDWYKDRLVSISNANPKLDLQDLPGMYKQVHESFQKYMDSVKRSERESYVSDKKKEANTPASTTRGKPAVPGKKEISQDPAEARQQMIQEVLKESRAANKF